MYRKIEDFQKDWAYESEATLKLINALTDESLSQKVTNEGRSLGFLAWHLATTLSEMFGHAGLSIDGPAHDSEMPASVAEIASGYAKGSQSLSETLAQNWSDGQLEDELPMYGEQWKKGVILYALICHQAHHRGQITVLMRQAGLKVPGIYGPAREEWEAMGIPAMA
ncbi:MAG: DinB [Acidobacteria bacterium]|jgi:uncharacterized damage-inducible protein DinB|nr:DinB [Acidobacteriota bacterium]